MTPRPCCASRSQVCLCFNYIALSNSPPPSLPFHPTGMHIIAQNHPLHGILMTHQSLTTVCSLRMLPVRRDDDCAWTLPSVRRVLGELTLLPTGPDLTITCMLKGRTGDASRARQERAILCVRRRPTVWSAVYSLGDGQQQRGSISDAVRERRSAVGIRCGPHAQLVSRGGTAVRASGARCRMLPA